MDKIKDLVSEELKLIEECFNNLGKSENMIFDDLNKFVNGKSKRIRSLICLLYLKANNINITDDIITLLFALELIHNASLLHDDVVDDSFQRRGLPTLFSKFGSKLSVLSGDYILSIALEKILKLKNDKILNIFLEMAKSMSEAEINQFLKRNEDITVDECIKIAEGKTASLFSAGLESAAILTGADVDTASLFGTNFGILFQINNDFDFDSVKNDNKNGVKTVVNILGIEKTLALKDNYNEELSKILVNLPDNKYKQGIEDLIKIL